MPHEVWIDMGGHPDPTDVASLLLSDVATRFTRYGLKAGLAPAKWVAEIVSQDVDRDALRLGLQVVAPATNMVDFLEQVPTSLLKPIPEKHRTRLEFLGYRWARTVASAQLNVLTEQFGKDAFMIYECARGRALDKIEPNYPGGAMSSRISFDHPQDSALLIEQAFTYFLGKLAFQLCATDQTAEEMRLFCEVEDGQPIVWRRSFARPVQAASPLRVAVSALWNQAKDKRAPIA